MLRLLAALFVPLAALSSSAGPPQSYLDLVLGEVDFPVSTSNRDAASWFHYGLLHLFCFGYDYALDAFKNAQKLDPAFALPLAFEAFTNVQPLWNTDDVSKGSEILASITPEQLAAASDRERKYIHVFNAHFNADTSLSQEDRLANAIEAWTELMAAYPSDSSAVAFRALWGLNLSPFQTEPARSQTLDQALADLKSALSLDPTHPGAVHYTIHAYDWEDVNTASLALPASELYPQIVRSASHGNHMPCHIYMRLGMWSRAYENEQVALEAAHDVCDLYGRKDDVSCDMYNLYHSVEFLHYYGFHTGQLEASRSYKATMDDAVNKAEGDLQAILTRWQVRMQAREVIESALLDANVNWPNPPPSLSVPLPSLPAQMSTGSDYWDTHTEGGALLAAAVQLFLHRRGSSPSSDSAARSAEIVQRLDELSVVDPLDPNMIYVNQLNAMHSKMASTMDLYATFLEERSADSNSAWKEALGEATSAEDALRVEASSPTLSFYGAHELAASLLAQEAPLDYDSIMNTHYKKELIRRGNRLAVVLGQARVAAKSGRLSLAASYYALAESEISPDHDDDLSFYEEIHMGALNATAPVPDGEDADGGMGSGEIILVVVVAVLGVALAAAVFAIGNGKTLCGKGKGEAGNGGGDDYSEPVSNPVGLKNKV